MTSYNWFLIHHGDHGRRGSKVCSRSHGSRVRDSPHVTLRLYLAKYEVMVMDVMGVECVVEVMTAEFVIVHVAPHPYQTKVVFVFLFNAK